MAGQRRVSEKPKKSQQVMKANSAKHTSRGRTASTKLKVVTTKEIDDKGG